MLRSTWLVALLVAGGTLLLAACGSGEPAGGGGVRVVASTPLIAEFAGIVAGADATVVGIVPAGVDIHTYEPAPGAAASIAEADLILVNGHGLEGALLKVIDQNASGGTPIVEVSAGITDLLGADEGDGVDPHLWLDVRNAMHYVEQTRDALIEVDPAHEGGYRERAGAYLAELEALHAELQERLGAIPAESRRLVVFHDAFGYFARAYGFEVLAAVLPAGGQQDPSAGGVADLIQLVKDSGVRVVFAEPQFNAAVLEQVAAETGAKVHVLYATFAGDVDTYIGMMRADEDALVEALSP